LPAVGTRRYISELYQLNSFVVVAEEGNVTKAAERLHTSQPAVSTQIKALESELGVTLFTRTPKGMILTREGVELKSRAATILEGVHGLQAAADRLRGELNGDVLLGVNTEPRLLRLAAIYEELRRFHPGLSLNVLETMSWEAPQKLLAGKVDLAFTYTNPYDERIRAYHIDWVELAVVAPVSWQQRLARATLHDLTTLPWVWTSQHCPLCALQQDIFETVGREPEKSIVVDQEAAILKLVSEGVGLGIVPTNKLQHVTATHHIVGVTVLEKKLRLLLLHRKQQEQDQKVAALLDVIGKVWNLDLSEEKAEVN
jgi:DNA-binding transcriptional LysR family regulator